MGQVEAGSLYDRCLLRGWVLDVTNAVPHFLGYGYLDSTVMSFPVDPIHGEKSSLPVDGEGRGGVF